MIFWIIDGKTEDDKWWIPLSFKTGQSYIDFFEGMHEAMVQEGKFFQKEIFFFLCMTMLHHIKRKTNKYLNKMCVCSFVYLIDSFIIKRNTWVHFDHRISEGFYIFQTFSIDGDGHNKEFLNGLFYISDFLALASGWPFFLMLMDILKYLFALGEKKRSHIIVIWTSVFALRFWWLKRLPLVWNWNCTPELRSP